MCPSSFRHIPHRLYTKKKVPGQLEQLKLWLQHLVPTRSKKSKPADQLPILGQKFGATCRLKVFWYSIENSRADKVIAEYSDQYIVVRQYFGYSDQLPVPRIKERHYVGDLRGSK